MAPDGPIDLICSEAGWLKVAKYTLILIVAVSLLTANTTLPWKFISLAGLVAASFILHLSLRCKPLPRRIRLFSEGHVTLVTAEGERIAAMMTSHAWSSPWLCILPVIRANDGLTLRLPICRSRNHSEDYRKLLRVLRLGSDTQHQDGILDRL